MTVNVIQRELRLQLDDFLALGLDRTLWDREPDLTVNGRANAEIASAMEANEDCEYRPCPEAGPQRATPAGNVLHIADWPSAHVFPNTVRDVWIYQSPGEASNVRGLAVFQDGSAYLDPSGQVRATAVMEALVAAGRLAPLVAVFIAPGRERGAADPLADARQRSLEYDSCNAKYLSFLVDEVLPMVCECVGGFTEDPRRRLIGGISSGALCAFNAAWHGPEIFGRVLSHCGSFTNIRGGHNYPYLVRTTPRKPIEVFLQSGEQDADILYGHWPLANRQMAAALSFAGYRYRFEFGTGGHSLRHAGSLFAESLQWLLEK